MFGHIHFSLLCAAENERLSEQVSALREEAGADEAEALRDDVALLRTELIRLSDEVKRLQSAPRVSPPCHMRHRAGLAAGHGREAG